MGEGRAGGNLHNVKVGEHWRVQALRPYVCPLLEADGEKFTPPKQMVMTWDPSHLKDGRPNDDCCYYDVEVVRVNDEEGLLELRTIGDEPLSLTFEVLNDDTIVRFYRKTTQ